MKAAEACAIKESCFHDVCSSLKVPCTGDNITKEERFHFTDLSECRLLHFSNLWVKVTECRAVPHYNWRSKESFIRQKPTQKQTS